jgi:uncharacterized RDD family membrane protein YckC
MNQPPDPGMGVPEPEPPAVPQQGDTPPAAPPLSETPPAAPLPTAPLPPAEGTYQGYGVPAAPPGMYYDSESGLTLPQGVQLAGHGRRIGAYFLAIPLWIVTLVIGYIIWGLIVWSRGQTPALQVLGMRCWRPETRRVPGFWWMALREIIGRLVDTILGIITELTSFILFLATRERKGAPRLRRGHCGAARPRQGPGHLDHRGAATVSPKSAMGLG